MNYTLCKSYKEMSQKAAEIFIGEMKKKPDCIFGFATGTTPIGLYNVLSEKCAAGELDFSRVTTFNLDEYKGMDGNDEQSYRAFMNRNLFDRINIKKENTFVPDGKSEDPFKSCAEYDKKIEDMGGIDVQLLGIGFDGHIGFNEPDSCFTKATHVVTLDESTIRANSRFFESASDVPTKAVTMGMYSIMNAEKIVMVVNGKGKKEILDKALNGPITPEVPASIIQLHKNVEVFYTEEEFK